MGARDRFYTKVAPQPDGCWLWTGGSNPKGYGQVWYRGRLQNAHRVALQLEGVDVSGKTVDHTCFVHGCVRPSHLRTVTPKQNQEHRRGPQGNSTTGIRGVYWDEPRGKWVVRVGHHGKCLFIGRYADKAAAESAAIAARSELFTHDDGRGRA